MLADCLLPGVVIGLNGTLGSGKTRFAQGLGEGLGIDPDNITSPTFTLCVPYQGRLPLLHLDVYRIRNPEEIDELGLDEWIENGSVLVIEWYHRFANFLPPLDIEINFDLQSDDSRRIQLEYLTCRMTPLPENVPGTTTQ